MSVASSGSFVVVSSVSGGVAGAAGAGSSGGVASVVAGSFVLAGGGAFAAGLPAGVSRPRVRWLG